MTTKTPIEQWLAGLGLEATEVDACPVAGCALCHAAPVAVAA